MPDQPLRLSGRLRRTSGFHLDLDLGLPTRGVTAIIGASGSGKSTLLRIISGLERPPGFRVEFRGQRWDRLPAHKRPVAMTQQQPALMPHLTVLGNLRAVPGRRQLDEAIARFGLNALLKRKPAALSGGQQQRVALARACLKPARLWLLDEPLSALDAIARGEIAPMLRRLCLVTERPILYVTHDLGEVAPLADYLMILEGGRVVGAGSPEQVAIALDHPLSPMIDTSAILEAQFLRYDAEHDLSILQLNQDTLWLGGNLSSEARTLRLQVPARHVALALTKPEDTSILNCLTCRVVSLANAPRGGVFVDLDCAGQRLRAHITRLSADALKLRPQLPVFALIKSEALRVQLP